MTGSNTNRIKRTVSSLQSLSLLALLSVLIAGSAHLMKLLLEPGLVLPAFSVLLFSYAALAAIAAGLIHSDRNSKHVTLWDIAGGFTLIGCGATVLSEPDQAALLFERLFEQ